MTIPQFGTPQPGRDYPDRPAAFAIVEKAGQIALVRVSFEGGGGRTDLPGGGIDRGETAPQAAARECGEEAGLVVEIGEAVTRADHFFVNEKDVARNTRGVFYAGRLLRDDPSLKVEHDHALVWTDPHEALLSLERESHVWAVACWLRMKARR
ncbi:NUDIX domain-containing protein [Phenylobacterium sp.]|uniref:NUDIX domain-containing protein n=1 Tax=Phenylobacterium sp. TaxID=1871053 RepID=UPI002DF47111|nr:NUDIX domain-containing protein [Phenylobacterium sp.]